jgi:hypothetical protein
MTSGTASKKFGPPEFRVLGVVMIVAGGLLMIFSDDFALLGIGGLLAIVGLVVALTLGSSEPRKKPRDKVKPQAAQTRTSLKYLGFVIIIAGGIVASFSGATVSLLVGLPLIVVGLVLILFGFQGEWK